MEVNLIKIEKVYSGKKLFNQLSYNFTESSINNIIGKNASGKSTLLRLIVGLVKQDSGEIFYTRNNLRFPYKIAKKYIGYVGNRELLLENLSGYEYFNFVGRIYKLPKSEIQRSINTFINIFKVDPKIFHQNIKNYSSGYKKMTELISALIHKPELLVLDEPFNSLDADFKNNVKEYLLELRNLNITIIIATHDIKFSQLFSDKLLKLE